MNPSTRFVFLFALFQIASIALSAQALQIFPTHATVEDDVEIIYDASQGNEALRGAIGAIYAHTGVITSDTSGWQFTKSDACSTAPELRTERIGKDRYRLRFNIRSFYRVPQGTDVTKLAFTFHNADCSKISTAMTVTLRRPSFDRYANHFLDGDHLKVTDLDGDTLLVEAFAENIIRVRYSRQGEQPTTSFASVLRDEQAVPVKVTDQSGALLYEIGAHQIYIDKTTLRVHVFRNGELLLGEGEARFDAFDKRSLAFSEAAGGQFFGGGPRPQRMNIKGKTLELYNNEGGSYGLGDEQYKVSVPFVISSEKYGVFFDNHFPAEIAVQDGLAFHTEGGAMDYWLLLADNHRQIVQDYTKITGRQPLPPRWGLGYIQSRFGYKSEEEARQIVNDMLAAGFPLDAIVLDLYWFGEIETMGNLDWDREKFPNPEEMVSDFQALGIETILITEPYVTKKTDNYEFFAKQDFFAETRNGEPYIIEDFWTGPAALLDIYELDTRNWLAANVYDKQMDIGVHGWWSDLGEPQEAPDDLWYERGNSRAYYNPFSLVWARLIHETFEKEHPGLRTFNLLRSGYAGMQRYGAFPWTGDVGANYGGLQAQIPLMLQASINGLAYMHSDAGGFMGDVEPNPELFTRWLQFSAFTPVMRPHSNGNGHLPEPIFYADTIQAIIRDFANLRHELMPYNYTLAYENSMHGTPLARPLFFYDDSPLALFHANDEYFWGENFLVAPILTEGSRERLVYFPKGSDWINFWTNELHRGGEQAYVKALLQQMPLFVRAGSFVPMSLPYQTMSAYDTETLLVHYFLDANVSESQYTMYNDDGALPEALSKQAFETLHFYATHRNNQLVFRFDQSGGYEGMPESRELRFLVHCFERAPQTVRYNGQALDQSSAADDFDQRERGWRWDREANKLYIKVQLESGQKGEITVK